MNKTKMNKKFLIKLLIGPVVIGGLVLSFIGSMHLIAGNSGLPGYRGGPQDAFRHALASAYITKYISPNAVEAFTKMSEQNPTSDHDKMDIHNNKLGKDIGLSADNIYQSVMERVKAGQVNSSYDYVMTWLSEDRWRDFWE